MNFFSSFKTTKKTFDSKKYMFFWFRHYQIIFLFFFLIVFGYGSFSWHTYLNRYRWSEDTKRQFLEANFKETSFKESKFKDLVERLKARDRIHSENVPLTKDIFEGKSL